MQSDTLYPIMLSVLSGEATKEESHLLDEWLASSDANRREFERFEMLYRRLQASGKEMRADYDTDQAWQKISRQTIGRKKTFTLRPGWRSYAAMVAIVLSVGLYFLCGPSETTEHRMAGLNKEEKFNQPTLLLENGERILLKQDSFSIQQGNMVIHNNSVNKLSYESDGKKGEKGESLSWNHLVIPKGNAYELMLADGTHIWLNAESELSYPVRFSGDKREVSLKGEAFFDVAGDPDRPFIVRTNGMDVKVLGTSFNVSAYESEPVASVTLVKGSVAVWTGKGERLKILPSEQLCYDKHTSGSTIQQVDTRLFTSWIKGEYIFHDATLDEIFGKLRHWYDFTVQYQEEALRLRRFSLAVDRKISLAQLLELLSFTSDVKLEKGENDNTIHVKTQKEGGEMKK